MRALALVTTFALSALTSVSAQAKWETSINLNPRFESIAADVPDWARRGFFKSTLLTRKGDFSFNFEGFLEYDIAQTALEPFGKPDLRKARSTGAVQELYADARFGSFFFRAGRQPVRWSQSWTIPSLDVFTGRRWNRLFVDPVPEQLTHPDGVLVSYAGAIEVDVFHAIQRAENDFPEPLPNVPRAIRDQTGARVKVRLGGFDFALVGFRSPEEDLYGGSVSYAFESFVIKAEGGVGRYDTSGFGLAGVDYFGNLGDLQINFSPQATYYKDPLLTGPNGDTIYYVPLQLTYGKTSFETQYYASVEARDVFGSVMLTREISDYKGASLKASVFHQSYAGRPGRLFSLYETLTGSSLAGLRIDLNYTL